MYVIPFVPSSDFDQEKFEAGISILEGMGYEFSSDHLEHIRSYKAFEDKWYREFFDIRIKEKQYTLWAVRGGYGAIHKIIEPGRPFLSKQPECIVGFSDVSAYLLHAYYNSTVPNIIHASNITGIANLNSECQKEYQPSRLLQAGSKLLTDMPDLAEQLRQGFLISNISVLSSLIGTEIFNKSLPKVIALEEVGEKTYRIVRSIAQLHYSGKLEKTKSIIIGQLDISDFDSLKKQLSLYFGDSFKCELIHWPFFGHGNVNYPLKFMR